MSDDRRHKHDPGLVERIAAAMDRAGHGYDLPTGDALLDALKADGLTIAPAPPELPAGAFTVHDAERQPILPTGLGAAAALMQPTGELAFVLDIVGRRNQPPSAGDYAGSGETVEERYLLAPGQAAELVVAVLNAARRGGDPSKAALDEALEAMKSPDWPTDEGPEP